MVGDFPVGGGPPGNGAPDRRILCRFEDQCDEPTRPDWADDSHLIGVRYIDVADLRIQADHTVGLDRRDSVDGQLCLVLLVPFQILDLHRYVLVVELGRDCTARERPTLLGIHD
jgi:hypothetical protein